MQRLIKALAAIALVLMLSNCGTSSSPHPRTVTRHEGGHYCPLNIITEEHIVFAETEEVADQMLGRIAHCEMNASDRSGVRWWAIILRLAVVNYQRRGWTETACSQRHFVEETIVPRLAGDGYTQSLLRGIHDGCP